MSTDSQTRNRPIAYLRGFLVALVVAHHSALAFVPSIPLLGKSLMDQPRLWQAFPILDTVRSTPLALLVGFNDVFFMALMFFVSGLFVVSGLRKAGSTKFLQRRLQRLGVPFVISVVLLAPIAYYPAFLQGHGAGGLVEFVHQWLSLGNLPAGPAWFLWVLLGFDLVVTLLTLAVPKWGEGIGAIVEKVSKRPIVALVALILVSGVAYVPLAMNFTAIAWTQVGPFTFQTSRILLYFVYFVFGAGAGAYGLDKGLLEPAGKLARRWPLWSGGALLVFLIYAVIGLVAAGQPKAVFLNAFSDGGFALTCGLIGFAMLAIFVRFGGKGSGVLDRFSESSYHIYLVHYLFLSWIQYALLSVPLAAELKFLLVVTGALALSWVTAEALRRASQFASRPLSVSTGVRGN